MGGSLFVHYSESGEVSAATIDSWHRTRGFTPRGSNPLRHIGYHWVIHRDGSIEAGRSDDVAGCHCPGWNLPGVIAVCLIGSDREPWYPSEAQYRATATLVERYAPRQVWLHREQYPTSCPGRFDKNRLMALVGGEKEEEEMPRFEKLKEGVYACARINESNVVYIHAESEQDVTITCYAMPYSEGTITTEKGLGGWAHDGWHGGNYRASDLGVKGEGRLIIHSPCPLAIEVG